MAIVIAVFQRGRGTSETLKDSQRAERYDEQSNRKCLCESLFLIPDLGFLTRVSGNLLEARQQEQAGGWRAGGGQGDGNNQKVKPDERKITREAGLARQAG